MLAAGEHFSLSQQRARFLIEELQQIFVATAKATGRALSAIATPLADAGLHSRASAVALDAAAAARPTSGYVHRRRHAEQRERLVRTPAEPPDTNG
ncbi:MAG: hypothetical protein ACRDNZ_00025 [Streptosporangiaceae bacterium]